MHVADSGEQVMLYLVVEASHQPGKNGIASGEVHGGAHLVLSPVVFEVTLFGRQGEFSLFNYVSRLEDHGKRDSGNIMQHQKAQEPLQEAHFLHNEVRQEHISVVYQLGEDKYA